MATKEQWQRLQRLIVQYSQVYEQQGQVEGLLRSQLFEAVYEAMNDLALRDAYRNSAGRNVDETANEVTDLIWRRNERFTKLVLTYDPNKHTTAYTFFKEIVRNAWLDWLRKNNDKRPFEHRRSDDDEVECVIEELDRRLGEIPLPADLTQPETSLLKRTLYAAIKNLEPRQQAVLMALDFENLTQEECARRMNISVSTLKRDYATAKERLQSAMAPRGRPSS